MSTTVTDGDARPAGTEPAGDATPAPERLAQVNDALSEVRARIARAAQAAGRDPAGITLIAVTKSRPASDVVALASLGITDVGENKDQEARAKHAEVGAALRWHLVGRLQSNKANSVTRYAAAVHSLDRRKLVAALDRGVAHARDEGSRSLPLEVFLQVSLDGDGSRGGASATDVPALADAVADADGLVLAGVMAVAPVGWEATRAFTALAGVSSDLRAHHPAAVSISAGMSADLEAAIDAGSTHVRVGSALLGRRTPVLS